jgi:ribosomal protein S18 acetylase RimI-like enzyme
MIGAISYSDQAFSAAAALLSRCAGLHGHLEAGGEKSHSVVQAPYTRIAKPWKAIHGRRRLMSVSRQIAARARLGSHEDALTSTLAAEMREIRSMAPTIRPARTEEYDEIAKVWMESWVSTGLAEESRFLLANLRARVPREIDNGWSLFVVDDGGDLAAMLALHVPKLYLDQLFVAPAWQGRSLGRQLLAFTRTQLPDEIVLRCVRENEKAWRWYEREGFVFEGEQVEPMNGFMMKHYRWKRGNEK